MLRCVVRPVTCNNHISGQVRAKQHTRLLAPHTGSGRNTVPSINAVTLTVNGKETYIYPTGVLTQGGADYSKQVTQKPMTVIYTMDKKQSLPTGYL